MDIIQQIRNRQAQTSFMQADEPPPHKPEMLYIGCVDARLAIDSDIGIPHGKAMIFRNIAAVVPKCSSNREALRSKHITQNDEIPEDISIGAVLEFYLNGLPDLPGRKKQLVVSGHTNCGGIHACQHGAGEHQDLALYLDILKDARNLVNNKAGAEGWDELKTLRELEKQSVRQSVANLSSYSVVKKALAENRVEIHGWLIDTATHRIYTMNSDLEFVPMS